MTPSGVQTYAAGENDGSDGVTTDRHNDNLPILPRRQYADLIYGDELEATLEHDDESLLLLNLNLNGLVKDNWKAKNDMLRDFLKKYDFDIMVFQETNLNWSVMPPKDQWDERTFGWWKGGHTTSKAHNTADILSSISQPGGCMVTSVNRAKHKATKCGVDERGLGR